MESLLHPEIWLAFFTLASLEIVLGIDNIIFLSILTSRLPPQQQPQARRLGLVLAMFTRIGLLLSLTWLMQLNQPLFTVFSNELSARDLVLILGGLFLIAKSTLEIHHDLEGRAEKKTVHTSTQQALFVSIVLQIAIIDIVFSLDSVITAIGLVKNIQVMIAAIVAAMLVMLFLAAAVSEFIDKHPTVKMLALSFLLLIGIALIGDGLDLHIPKGYIYFAITYSLLLELLNLRLRRAKTKLSAH